MHHRRSLLAAAVVLGAVLLSSCGPSVATAARRGTVLAVGAEDQYANVIGQIGGRYVTVDALMENPNTDPHAFEASPQVDEAVAAAELVVQNGLGYDQWIDSIEAATPDRRRTVITVARLLGVPASDPNPHLWYGPRTMPAVAAAVASDLSRIQPGHRSYFAARLRAFDVSLRPWYRALAAIRHDERGATAATTEPVGDDLLAAAGVRDLTPLGLQLAIMNGIDPSPEAVGRQEHLLSGHGVDVLLYNQQVTDSLTESFLASAHRAGIPVVGVYETMPVPGYNYQSWMLAETRALARALTAHLSTEKL